MTPLSENMHILISSAAFVGWGWFCWVQGVKEGKNAKIHKNVTPETQPETME